MESNSLLMLADIARLDDRHNISINQPDQESSPLDGVDHSYLANNDFEFLVNGMHNYYDRITQAEQETDVDHSYAFLLPNTQTTEKENPDPGPSWYVDPLTDPSTSFVHGVPFPDPLLRCEWNGCSFECEITNEMSQHVDAHLTRGTRFCKWRECQKAEHEYTARYILRHHLLTHLNLKPFHCEECGKNFRTKERALLHKRAHHQGEEESRYKCDRCAKLFKTTADRRAHVKRIHLNTRFKCSVCSQLFAGTAVLRKHIKRFHTVESLDPESKEWKMLHI